MRQMPWLMEARKPDRPAPEAHPSTYLTIRSSRMKNHFLFLQSCDDWNSLMYLMWSPVDPPTPRQLQTVCRSFINNKNKSSFYIHVHCVFLSSLQFLPAAKGAGQWVMDCCNFYFLQVPNVVWWRWYSSATPVKPHSDKFIFFPLPPPSYRSPLCPALFHTQSPSHGTLAVIKLYRPL